ncbi:SDR family oxidoreductase [Clostridium beijerinckii]|uniref:3-oxoacyl-[acyl-carrier protein] reductase n=1 Tax=Clostridium beijerinckii TaxID=1520 RepID=A0AAE5LSR0_CLOBE|nr:SDR family NAD(P)-dependent oxidoreductase [Clostridium beijerinckii]AQS18282.1 SDR family oxidoreductase [Clostridium beijerinckii NRRL B-598]NSB17160.1 3-oxoacyl-[acyl-carrier protein] reductase [Clostridium beijerinckii]OOM23185.1 3-oxoacyl-[acyl-carrier-protein] reductase FabG [Clostridium beijerinckii]
MSNKICLITGAAEGIGKATLIKFLTNGYYCFGIDVNPTTSERLMNEVPEHLKSSLDFINCNLLENESIEYIYEKLEQIADRDTCITLINNVGGSIYWGKEKKDLPWERFMETLNFNLKPMYHLSKKLINIMKKSRRGNIVNISSISGRAALHTVGEDYSAAKAAVIGFSRRLASEVAEYNILVNTVCPGIIGTERILERWRKRDEKENQNILKLIPLKRIGNPKEVANSVYFLGSEENTYITGAILDVNGGMYIP